MSDSPREAHVASATGPDLLDATDFYRTPRGLALASEHGWRPPFDAARTLWHPPRTGGDGDVIDCSAAIMRGRHSNSRIALRAPASGGWLRQSLTSIASRASLRRANNDGLRFSSISNKCPLFDPRRRRRVEFRGRPSPRPLHKATARRAGQKRRATRRRERSHAQLALASEHGEHPPFDATEHRGIRPSRAFWGYCAGAGSGAATTAPELGAAGAAIGAAAGAATAAGAALTGAASSPRASITETLFTSCARGAVNCAPMAWITSGESAKTPWSIRPSENEEMSSTLAPSASISARPWASRVDRPDPLAGARR